MIKKSVIFMMIVMSTLLSGCSHLTVFKQDQIRIPVNQYQCINPTNRPSGDSIMESQVAKYISSLERTIPDCKLRLRELQVIIECFNDKKCHPDSLMKGLAVADEKNPR